MSDTLLRAGKALCRPATDLIDKHHQRKIDIQEGLRRDPEKAPPQTLKQRKRALASEDSKTLVQPSSLLLIKLPVELRQAIWIECVGGMTVHLKIWDRSLRAVCCRCRERPSCKHLRRFQDPDCEPGPLSLLLSCRQVYVDADKVLEVKALLIKHHRYNEAIELLYATNTFKVLNEDCLLYLPKLLLPQRIDTIKSIHFEWSLNRAPGSEQDQKKKQGIPYNDLLWAEIWKNVASMKGLKHLWVGLDIGMIWWQEWLERQRTVFEPLRAVTTPKQFTLITPFLEDLEQEYFAELPCQIPLKSKLP